MLRTWAQVGVLAVVLGAALPAHAQQADPSSPAADESWAVAASGEEPERRGWEAAKADALAGLERLRADIQVLGALRTLQVRLLEWNTVLIESGAAPAALEASLCDEREVRIWCDLLPATFGRLGEDG